MTTYGITGQKHFRHELTTRTLTRTLYSIVLLYIGSLGYEAFSKAASKERTSPSFPEE